VTVRVRCLVSGVWCAVVEVFGTAADCWRVRWRTSRREPSQESRHHDSTACVLPFYASQCSVLSSRLKSGEKVGMKYFFKFSVYFFIFVYFVQNYSIFRLIVSWWRFGLVGNVVGRINEVNQRRTRLVLGWVTILVCHQPPRSTQPGHPFVGRRNEYQRKLGRKQALRAMS